MTKQMNKFTFYELYWTLIKHAEECVAGGVIRNICKAIFTEEEVACDGEEEAFIWSNIEKYIAKTKAAKVKGKTPGYYDKKMRHFTFEESFYKAIKLMTKEDCGAYIKAICGYFFDGSLPTKLKPPVDGYFVLAKKRLDISIARKQSGSKGGRAERVKITDEELQKIRQTGCCEMTYYEFRKYYPHIVNDLYESNRHLLKGVRWIDLYAALCEESKYKKCRSLTTILKHKKELEALIYG